MPTIYFKMDIKKYYQQSFEIIKRNKKIIFILTALYILFLVSGLIYNSITYTSSFSSEDAKKAYNEFFKTTIVKDTFIGNFIYIFSHNIIASLFRIVTGIVLGIIPIFYIISDGISNSYSLVSSMIDEGVYRALLGFLPHSLFETPAFILSSSLGLMIFISVFKKDRMKNIIKTFKESLIVFTSIILPLLFIAAIIESVAILIYWF